MGGGGCLTMIAHTNYWISYANFDSFVDELTFEFIDTVDIATKISKVIKSAHEYVVFFDFFTNCLSHQQSVVEVNMQFLIKYVT